ncbi:MAG: Na+/H+ antiporter subunit E [Blautia sp.]|nr:Na+/H+ antiporter subunit E [Blautia sp.]
MSVLLFALWIIWNGKITAEIIIIGLLVTIVVSFFAHKAVGYSPASDLAILRNTPIFILYILNLIREIVKAALSVMIMIFQAEEPDPVIIEFHSGFHTNLQNVLLANSITLTPGTITLFQEGDHLVIHCLRREYAEGMENSSFVRILRHLK